jgi:plasmid stability protein
MSVALQIRDVPEDVRDALAAEAAKRGQSVQAYLLGLVQREARIARQAQVFDRLAAQRVVIPDELKPEDVVREGRDAGFETDRR